jgi:hypothetical protein
MNQEFINHAGQATINHSLAIVAKASEQAEKR